MKKIYAKHDLEHPGPSTTGSTSQRYTWWSQNFARKGDGENSVVVVTGLSGESRLSETGLIIYMRGALMDNISMRIRLKNANSQSRRNEKF